MKIEPLLDRLVVKAIKPQDMTKGGLYIPENAKEQSQEGEVVAIGPGRYEAGNLIDMRVKVGDRILFGKYIGSPVTIDCIPYLIIRELDVLAILKTEESK